MGMAKGIADGMKYLAGIQFVHRVRFHKTEKMKLPYYL
jgi:hypothetical protein